MPHLQDARPVTPAQLSPVPPLDSLTLPDRPDGHDGTNCGALETAQLSARHDLDACAPGCPITPTRAPRLRTTARRPRGSCWGRRAAGQAAVVAHARGTAAVQSISGRYAAGQPLDLSYSGKYSRGDARCRPFNGPLSPASQRQALMSLNGMPRSAHGARQSRSRFADHYESIPASGRGHAAPRDGNPSQNALARCATHTAQWAKRRRRHHVAGNAHTVVGVSPSIIGDHCAQCEGFSDMPSSRASCCVANFTEAGSVSGCAMASIQSPSLKCIAGSSHTDLCTVTLHNTISHDQNISA